MRRHSLCPNFFQRYQHGSRRRRHLLATTCHLESAALTAEEVGTHGSFFRRHMVSLTSQLMTLFHMLASRLGTNIKQRRWFQPGPVDMGN